MIKILDILESIELQIVNEIGDGSSKSFPWFNKFYTLGNSGLFTMFLAPLPDDVSDTKIPEIQVTFAKLKPDTYQVGYSVNDTDLQSFKTDSKYYLRIVSTVMNIIKEFLKKYNPRILEIDSIDKSDVKIPGQKSRIYIAYIEKNAPSLGYRFGHDKNKLILIKQ